MATGTLNRSKTTPRLVRLFRLAGLLDDAQWNAFIRRQQKHKPILEVLTQEVSLESLRDLMNAEVTFRNSEALSEREALRSGLTTSRMVDPGELSELLAIHRRPVPALLEPLRQGGLLSEELEQRAAESAARHPEADPSWLLEERIIAPEQVMDWLGQETPHMRRAALVAALTVLQSAELLDDPAVEDAVRLIETEEISVATRLVAERHGLGAQQLLERVEEGLAIPAVPVADIRLEPALLAMFPESILRHHQILPVFRRERLVGLVMSDPLNLPLLSLVHWATGHWAQPFFASSRDILNLLAAHFQAPLAAPQTFPAAPAAPAPAGPAAAAAAAGRAAVPARAEATPSARPRIEPLAIADNVSAVQLVSTLIEGAIDLRATDIHIEPTAEGMAVRYRIDGELHRITRVPPALSQAVISRIKVMADMDVTERRHPQDGHFELHVQNHDFDFRISTLPAIHGEKVVIRLLDSAQVRMGLEDLGLLPEQKRLFVHMLDRPHGMILVTGPTGSGKTSTLYTALNRLNTENRNLVTIEDPVEYQLPGVNQVQVDVASNMNFAQGLRAILRQDPDVVMVGEIRDGDTVQIAIRAAATGHLVLSTLHTNTAIGAVDTLINLGALPFMISDSLLGIISQRLVRKLCTECRRRANLTPEVCLRLGLPAETRKRVWRQTGCTHCLGSGYLGRTGVFEVIAISEPMRPLIATGHHDGRLEAVAREESMISLAQAATAKVLAGDTSVDEILRRIYFEI